MAAHARVHRARRVVLIHVFWTAHLRDGATNHDDGATMMIAMITDWRQQLVDDDAGLARIFRETRRVAVLGAKRGRSEPAFFVPEYLRQRGYSILPVNPTLVGE